MLKNQGAGRVEEVIVITDICIDVIGLEEAMTIFIVGARMQLVAKITLL